MPVKLSDIAKELNLSEATVSLAINGKSVVNEKTRETVINTARKMGYRPNAIAQSLAKQVNKTIGVIVPDIVNPYYGAAVKYCGKYINESGFNILFAFSNDDQSNENDIVNQFISQRVAGILIAPTNQGNMKTNYIDNLKRSEIPFLYFTSYYNDVDAPYSMINLESGSYQLIRYLLDLGHKEIFFLSSDKEMVSTKTRINGYIRAFKERGLVVDEDYFVNCKHVTFEQSVLSTESLLKSNRKIDAIVTMNDVMALGSLRVLLDNGIEIPDQISLAGYDDVLFSNISAIPITTVKQDLKRLCNISVDMLVNMINNGVRPENVMLQPELIVRRSTGRKK